MSQHVRVRAFDAILDDVFRQYRDYFVPLFLVSLVFLAPMTVIGAWLSSLVSATTLQTLLTPAHPGAFPNIFTALRQHPQSMAAIMSYLSIEFILTLISMNVVGPLSNGVYYLLARDTLVEHRMRGSVWQYIGKSSRRWGAYLSTLWLLVGLTAAAVAAIVLVFIGVAALGAALHAVPGMPSVIILFMVIAYLAVIVFSIWLSVRLMFAFLSVVLERERNWKAIKRSWFLTRDSFWRLFGIMLLAELVLGFANVGLYALITHFVPTGPVQVLAIGLISIVLAPLIHLLVTNVYVDLRIRREGYDLELQADAGDA